MGSPRLNLIRRPLPSCLQVAFDSVKQVQTASFLVNRPASVGDYQAPEKRSVA